ncbi:MAG: methionine ABC transporter ATP-binding protein, partial [Desulfuromonadales bacterium]|nr:methionine ABC transporter ATP-binding protein [Desulfuromonadales bacterium]
NLQRQKQMALILITHDLALVAEAAHRIVVMYAGQVVETGPVPEIFESPRHPYTSALLEALPERSVGATRLKTIPGVVPGQFDRPTGCLLHPRCRFATDRCRQQAPQLETGLDGRQVRCYTPLDAEGKPQQ